MATDTILVTRAQGNNREAFRELMKRYEKKIYHIAMGITGNNHDAEEVSQETFLSVYRNIAGFRNESSFNTWIFRITTNCALMNLRKKKTSAEIFMDGPLRVNNEQVKPVFMEVVDWRMNPERLFEKKELRLLILRLIRLLPKIYQTAFIMRVIKGFTNQQVADTLGISLPAAKSRALRARQLLREGLKLQWMPHPDSNQKHFNRYSLS